jgi:hypothetical protein
VVDGDGFADSDGFGCISGFVMPHAVHKLNAALSFPLPCRRTLHVRELVRSSMDMVHVKELGKCLLYFMNGGTLNLPQQKMWDLQDEQPSAHPVRPPILHNLAGHWLLIPWEGCLTPNLGRRTRIWEKKI